MFWIGIGIWQISTGQSAQIITEIAEINYSIILLFYLNWIHLFTSDLYIYKVWIEIKKSLFINLNTTIC